MSIYVALSSLAPAPQAPGLSLRSSHLFWSLAVCSPLEHSFLFHLLEISTWSPSWPNPKPVPTHALEPTPPHSRFSMSLLSTWLSLHNSSSGAHSLKICSNTSSAPSQKMLMILSQKTWIYFCHLLINVHHLTLALITSSLTNKIEINNLGGNQNQSITSFLFYQRTGDSNISA